MLLIQPVAGDELVRFRSAAAPGEVATELQGYVTRPNGEGPFPAVVLFHSCLGLPSNRQAIGGMLANWGYLALFVDQFTTRGVAQTCLVDFPPGLADGYGALAYVAGRADVIGTRIAAVGYSQGGDTVLRLAVPRLAERYAPRGGPGYRAVAAYYPPCGNLGRTRLALPILILVGGEDSVTPAAACVTLARGQPNVRVMVYPGAGHVFNDPGFAGGKTAYGMHLQYDRDAAGQAEQALRAFLAAKLQ
jgi:dienelactone hydrolase